MPVFVSECNYEGYENDIIDGYYRIEKERVIAMNHELHQIAKRNGSDLRLNLLLNGLQRILEPLSKDLESKFDVLLSERL